MLVWVSVSMGPTSNPNSPNNPNPKSLTLSLIGCVAVSMGPRRPYVLYVHAGDPTDPHSLSVNVNVNGPTRSAFIDA